MLRKENIIEVVEIKIMKCTIANGNKKDCRTDDRRAAVLLDTQNH